MKTNLSNIHDFFETIYDLINQEKEDCAIDLIFEYINNLLVEGKFEICDQIIKDIKIEKLSLTLMISFLTITAAAKTKLNNRKKFFDNVQQLARINRNEKEVQRLLDGLD